MAGFRPLTDFQVSIESKQPARPEADLGDTVLPGAIVTEPFELALDPEHIALETALRTIDQLTAFKVAIGRHGVTRALIAFADHDKTLSAAIPAVPALETLTSDLSPKRSGDITAAVEASITDAIEVFLRKLRARAKNLIARIAAKGEHLDAKKLHIKTLKEMIGEGRVFDEHLAKTRQYTLLRKDKLETAMKIAEELVVFTEKFSGQSLPDGEAAYKAWLGKVRAAINPRYRPCGGEINEIGRLVSLDSDSELDVARGTLVDHGYTSLGDFDHVLREFDKVDNPAERYMACVKKIVPLMQQSHGDPTLAYLHKAAVLFFNVIWTNATWSMWLLNIATFDVLKAIFACTEKHKA